MCRCTQGTANTPSNASDILALTATMVAGSTKPTVFTPPSPGADPGWLAWSPDGAWLAYVWTGPDAEDEYRQEIRLQRATDGDPVMRRRTSESASKRPCASAVIT